MSEIHRDDVLKKFTATQMLGVHSSRAIKRQRLDRFAKRTLRNVENLLKFQRTGMASRRENFVECISNMGELDFIEPRLAPTICNTHNTGPRVASDRNSDNLGTDPCRTSTRPLGMLEDEVYRAMDSCQ